MKVVLLAGGLGTRLAEESSLRPKPMIEIGELPLLLHIMKIYSHYGFNDFVVCLGFKGYFIKEYFSNFALHRTDVTYDFAAGTIDYFNNVAEPWRVSLINTGLHTMTGGRLKRIQTHLENETFMLTYGDGVADLDISKLLAFHRQHGRAATVTAVRIPGRFGSLEIDQTGCVESFHEKKPDEFGWVSGGFFVLEPSVIDLIEGDETIWERQPLEQLAAMGQLAAYKHTGFWQPVDSLREKQLLEELWAENKAPWRLWK